MILLLLPSQDDYEELFEDNEEVSGKQSQYDYEQVTQICNRVDEIEELFQAAFFPVVIPWMRINIRAENEYRELFFLRDWVEERFFWALEEQVPLYRSGYEDAVMVPASLAWHAWRFPAREEDFTFIYDRWSSGVFTWFHYQSHAHDSPYTAVTSWLHEVHTWYHTGRWHTRRGVEIVLPYSYIAD